MQHFLLIFSMHVSIPCLNGVIPAGKAAGLSVAGLALGTLVGSGIQAWLRVDIVPLGVSFLLGCL